MARAQDKDVISITPATHDLDGSPLEPEERPAQRAQSVPVSLQLGHTDLITHDIPCEAIFEATAGEIASGMRVACGTCKHFDNVGWRKLMHEWSHSSNQEQREFMQECRRVIADTQDLSIIEAHEEQGLGVPDALAGIDVDHAMFACGICRAVTEIRTKYTRAFDPLIVFPTARCPDMNGPGGENLRHLYQPRDQRAASVASNAYDKILKMALGRKE